MSNVILKLSLGLVIISLTSCAQLPSFNLPIFNKQKPDTSAESKGLVATSIDSMGNETDVNITMTGGKEIGLKSMSVEDKQKMSRALEAAPGKSTHWQNLASHISYTVTPIKKVVIDNNPFCRAYEVIIAQGKYSKTINGTACITADGGWHTI